MASGVNYKDENAELNIVLVHVRRVTKVTSGGRKFRITTLVVVGDGKGRVGFGHAKAREVIDAKSKAVQQAKRNMIKVNLREGRTLHHDIIGHYGATKIIMRSAPAGVGIKAGGACRSIFGCLGVEDVVAKCIGSSNPYNMVRAVFDALYNLSSPRSVAQRRGLRVGDIVQRREAS